jgi:hypothetical protein
MVTVKIDAATGELARPEDDSAIEEIFRAERTPQTIALPKTGDASDTIDEQETRPEQVF